jgi:hypothetical protein
MQLGRHLHELWRLRIGLAISVSLGLIAALISVAHVGIFPPTVHPRTHELASAATRVLVDSPKSSTLDLGVSVNDIASATNRALLVANVMASAPVREYISRRAHVPADVLQVASPVTPDWPRPLASNGNAKHTTDLLKSVNEYRLSLQSNPTVPVVIVDAEAPTPAAAKALANGAVDGMRDYLRDLGVRQGIPKTQQVELEQLGRATGSVVDGGANFSVALLSFLIVFGTSSAAAVFFSRVRRGWALEAGQLN